jgi:hypothetical protein
MTDGRYVTALFLLLVSPTPAYHAILDTQGLSAIVLTHSRCVLVAKNSVQ